MAKQTKNIIVLIIIVISFAAVVYMISKSFASRCPDGYVYDEEQKKCREICSEGTRYYASVDKCLACPPNQIPNKRCYGGCMDKCSETQEICGCSCIDPTREICIEGNPCSLSKMCGKVCCPNDTKCVNGFCVKCDEKDVICNGVCCADGQICTDNKVCCDKNRSCKDGSCCDKECCGDKCCPPDQECVDGICKIKCGDGDNVKFCNPDTEKCFTNVKVNGGTKNLCKKTGCEWTTINYSPYIKNGESVVDSCYAENKTKIITCNNPSISGGGRPYERAASSTQSPTSKADCTEDDCYYRAVDKGADQITYTETTDGKICSIKYDCDKLLDKCAECPFKDTKYKSSCCVDSSGNYTGQICGDKDQICVGGQCYYGYKCIQVSPTYKHCVPVVDKPNPDDGIYGSFDECNKNCVMRYKYNNFDADVKNCNGCFPTNDSDGTTLKRCDGDIWYHSPYCKSNICECEFEDMGDGTYDGQPIADTCSTGNRAKCDPSTFDCKCVPRY